MSIKLFISIIGLIIANIYFIIAYENKQNHTILSILMYNLKFALFVPLIYISIILITYIVSGIGYYYNKIKLPDDNEFYWCWIKIIKLVISDIQKLIFRCLNCCSNYNNLNDTNDDTSTSDTNDDTSTSDMNDEFVSEKDKIDNFNLYII